MAKELWVEKYRPSTVKDYVFKDNTQRKQVQNWINDGGIPHLLFSGSPGTGKTTIAKVLINELSIEDADVLYINASRDNGVEMIRKKITAFSETMPWGDFKVILLDEADHISP
jgi:replication factor C small subunit